MKARFAYPLLFLLPSAMIAFLAAFIAAAGGAGVLWLFVFGDNTWPQAAGSAVMVCAAGASIASLALLLLASYRFGKRREPLGGLARQHIAAAIAMSVLLPVLVLLYEWQVGNFGS